jgi:ADYC domain
MSSSKPIDFALRAAWLAALIAVSAAVAIPAGVAGTDAAPVQTHEVQTHEVQTLEVEGTRFKITLADGRVLRSPDLIGANLLIDQGNRTLRVRLDGIETDPDDRRAEVADADRIWLHSLSVEAPDGSREPLCEAGPDGRRQAIPVRGRFSVVDGRFADGEASAFELACTGGAMGKCIRFGYHPWQTRAWPALALYRQAVNERAANERALQQQTDASSPSYLTLYNACLRMVRADYGGDGNGTTRNGMRIDLYDARGIEVPANDPRMAFEAGWTDAGAVCVNHPRVAGNVTLADIAARWPRLAGKTGAICTEEFARSLGALLYNRSVP